MNFQSYLNYFSEIMENSHPAKPYNNPAYVDFVKLNLSRVNRWLKHGIIDKALQHVVKKIDKPQRWIIITEPWCGDAAQIVPFIQRIAELNPLIQTDYELRDSPPFRINQYLTDGRSKSIPMLVAKDENGNDIFKWGPRPQPAQSLYKGLSNKKAGFEEIKIALQQWYNKDKGQTEEHELEALLTAIPE